MKNVLVIYYSQTGQLKEILKNFCSCDKGCCTFDFVEIQTVQYSFPLTWNKMLNMFPESVLQTPCNITFTIPNDKKYDLIVLGFQTWFLHLSLPVLSFIKTKNFNKIITGKDVCLIMDCRNSWQEAMSIVEKSIIESKGRIVGKYVFANECGNIVGIFPILNWFFTGNKKFACLPEAGLSKKEIEKAHYYGNEFWGNSNANHGVLIFPSDAKIMSYELEVYAKKKFYKWAIFVKKSPKYRDVKLSIFAIWLIGTLLFIAPFKHSRHDRKRQF